MVFSDQAEEEAVHGSEFSKTRVNASKRNDRFCLLRIGLEGPKGVRAGGGKQN